MCSKCTSSTKEEARKRHPGMKHPEPGKVFNKDKSFRRKNPSFSPCPNSPDGKHRFFLEKKVGTCIQCSLVKIYNSDPFDGKYVP